MAPRERERRTHKMIDEISAEKARDWMRDNANVHGQALSDKLHLEDFKKVKFSILFNEAPEETVAAKEAWAYAHPDYRELLEWLKAAREKEITLRHKYTAAEATIAVWQTTSANNRKVGF